MKPMDDDIHSRQRTGWKVLAHTCPNNFQNGVIF